MAVVKPDLEKETNDLWVIDNASGKAIQLTVSKTRENAGSPAWSPDGKQIAYVALRDGYFGLYRKASNAQGDEELLYKGSAPMTLTDWSQDGKYLTYFSTDLSGGGLYALPLAGTGERKPIEVFRNKSQNQGPRLSPDSRIMTYTSNVSGPDRGLRDSRSILRRRRVRHPRPVRGRSPIRAARAWCSGARTARSCTTWPPIAPSWSVEVTRRRHSQVRQAASAVPAVRGHRARHRPGKRQRQP